jgi:hypothetical protein
VARSLMHLAASRQEGRRGMLVAEINAQPAPTHPAARLFIDQGFAATAMGLQARAERMRPRGFGTTLAHGSPGGNSMANPQDRAGNSSESERESVRSSNDRDQNLEREGIESEHNRGYDEAVTGRGNAGDEEFEDIDPDSAASDVDRDDSIDEI